jgi:DNA ligase-1
MASGKRFKIGKGLSFEQRINPPKVGSVVIYRFQKVTSDGVPKLAVYVDEAFGDPKPIDAEICNEMMSVAS